MLKAKKTTNRIRELRDNFRMKQMVLAKRAGVFQSEISEIETGERIPNVYLAKKIASCLRTKVDELFL